MTNTLQPAKYPLYPIVFSKNAAKENSLIKEGFMPALHLLVYVALIHDPSAEPS